MTSAKQIYLGSRRGPALPYDAAVEYLQSTGTQWIDTGIAPTNHRTVVDFSAVSLQSLGYVAGSFNSNNRRYYPCVLDENYGIVILNKGNGIVYSRAIDTNRHIVDYYDYQDRCLFDGGAVGSVSSTLAAPLNNLALFATLTASGISGPSTARIYGVQVYERQNQEMVRDMIAVRFTNDHGVSEGAMYDRVSGQLFRNSGTGVFGFGTDIAGGGYKCLGFSPWRFSRFSRLLKEAA